MRPFRPALLIPPDPRALAADDAPGEQQGETAFPGRMAYRHDVQALFASESLGQALRQLAVYGRDGLPVISPDERALEGWVTSAGVLRALAHRIAGPAAETARAQAAADLEHDDTQAMLEHPPVPLPGYHVAEISITPDSPAAGRKLGEAGWPATSVPVSVLRDGLLRPPHRDIALAVGDRVSLLIPAAKDDAEPQPMNGQQPADAGGTS
jgi:CIC family chloride channel protein